MVLKIGSLAFQSKVYVPPMAGVTDIVFRGIVRRIEPNCLLATEMVSSRALMHRPEARIMDISKDEQPVGIQIFGHEPEVMAQAAQMAQEKGADFVDINMGCPVPKITKGKDGCALMREPELAREIISTVCRAVSIPVSVKFRLGWDDNSKNAIEFGMMIEESGASAVTVHGRTRQQLYSGKADWNFIGLVKKNLSIPVFGNGDVFEPEDALKLLEVTGCDGVAVARGTLGNPWLVRRISQAIARGIIEDPPDDIERLITAYRHTIGLIKYKGVRIGTNESRRHLTHYTKRIPHSAPYRHRLTQIQSAGEAKEILAELCFQVDGKLGKERFLFSIEQDDLKDGEHPCKRNCYSENSVHAPIDIKTISPIAVP